MSKRVARWLAGAALFAGVALTVTPAVAAAAPATSPTSSVEEAAAVVEPTIVHLTITWSGYVVDTDGYVYNGGRPYEVTFTCTGFVVDPAGYVVTAAHCVGQDAELRTAFVQMAAEEAAEQGFYRGASADDIYAYGLDNWTVEGSTTGAPLSVSVTAAGLAEPSGAESDQPVDAQVVATQPFGAGDVALLKVDRTGLPVLALTEGSPVDVGTPIVSVGYPGITADYTTDPTFKDGTVSASTTIEGRPYLEISAGMAGGMSGGPTVDGNGDVVGINSFGPTETTESFNYVTSSANLRELMTQNGVAGGLTPTDHAYRAGLDAYFAGDYSEAVEQFDTVLAAVPGHEVAAEYRTRAQQQQAQQGWPVSRWVLFTTGGAVLALLGAGTLVVVRRRAATPPGAPARFDVPAPWASQPVFSGPVFTPARTAGPGSATMVMSAVKHCPRCAMPAPGRTRFCAGCGTPMI
jgi:serine protease Do